MVPFLGAGVSAGAPSWGQLLTKLRTGIHLKEAEADAFQPSAVHPTPSFSNFPCAEAAPSALGASRRRTPQH